MFPVLRVTALALAMLSFPATASEPARIAAEIDALLLRLAESGQLPLADGGDFVLDRPERTRHELGAVVDVRGDGAPGLPVLAVTPGSAAERVGLRVGDRLLAINGHRFAAGQAAGEAFRTALGARDGAIELRVGRGGRELSLSGAADTVVIPAYTLTLHAPAMAAASDGCGRISTFDAAPRAQQIHPAVLIAIDGRLPGPTGSDSFRLTAGRHVLTVAEAIDARQFTAVQQYQRDRGARDRYKTFEIDVKPDTTYRLGARLITERRGDIADNAYWEPVLYGQFQERCR